MIHKKVVFNFSDRTLSSAEKSLLAKGLNLSIPPKNSIMVTSSNPLNHSTPVFLNHKQTHTIQNADSISASIKNASLECLNHYNPKIEQNLRA